MPAGEPLSYGDREPWKQTQAAHGSTHPARKQRAIDVSRQKYKNDGRAPDTTKQLVKPVKPLPIYKFMRKQLHVDGIRLFTDNSFQSYAWNGSNSCWFDASMEALFFCALHLKPKEFNGRLLQYADVCINLESLVDHVSSRLKIYEQIQSIPELQRALSNLRDRTATSLGLDLRKPWHPLVYSYLRCTQANVKYRCGC